MDLAGLNDESKRSPDLDCWYIEMYCQKTQDPHTKIDV